MAKQFSGRGLPENRSGDKRTPLGKDFSNLKPADNYGGYTPNRKPRELNRHEMDPLPGTSLQPAPHLGGCYEKDKWSVNRKNYGPNGRQ